MTELAAPFDISMPAISKHLEVLQRARLISRGRDAERRPCRLEAAPLAQAAGAVAIAGARSRRWGTLALQWRGRVTRRSRG